MKFILQKERITQTLSCTQEHMLPCMKKTEQTTTNVIMPPWATNLIR